MKPTRQKSIQKALQSLDINSHDILTSLKLTKEMQSVLSCKSLFSLLRESNYETVMQVRILV